MSTFELSFSVDHLGSMVVVGRSLVKHSGGFVSHLIGFYNSTLRQAKTGYLSPVEFELTLSKPKQIV